jgi:hypothetical protein
MSTVLALVASIQELTDLQDAFPDETDLGIVGTTGGAVGLFTGGPSLAADIFAAPQALVVVDDETLSALGPALDALTIDPTQIFAVLTTLFGAGNEGLLDQDAQSTLAGYLLTFAPEAQATLDASPSTDEELAGPCVHARADA